MSDRQPDTTTEEIVVCHRHYGGEHGGATVYYVRLPGGRLLECGGDPNMAANVAQALRDGNYVEKQAATDAFPF